MDGTRFSAYGYGWRLADVDGELSVSHTGSLGGMYSFVMLRPERKVGIVILANGEGDEARTVLNQVLVKRYTAPASVATVARYAESIAQESAAAPASGTAPDTSARTAVAPRELRAEIGIYCDAWFGEVSICKERHLVRFGARKSPLLDGYVMRVGNRLLVDWRDDRVDVEAWLDFVPAPALRQPATLTLAKVDPNATSASIMRILHSSARARVTLGKPDDGKAFI